MLSLLTLLACLGCEPRAAAPPPVDLALVLAVDVSESMDAGELEMQRAGYVAALRHPDFLRAVRTGRHGRIALAYFEWAGSPRPESLVGWRAIASAAEAESFAAALAERPLRVHRGTSISRALDHGAGLLDRAPAAAVRRAIDVSGDGPNNAGPPVAAVRDALVARGIVINGLPLMIRPSPIFPAMDGYYRSCVTGGPAAFVLPVRDRADLARAIREKLVLEISGAEPAAAVVPAGAAPVDCLVGEKARQESVDRFYPGLGP